MNHSSFTRELVRAFGPRLPLVTASAGPWSPDGLLTDGDTVAMVVTDGLMLREVQLGSARAVEILGAGDVFEVGRIAGKVLADEERFEVPQSATIAAIGVLAPDALAREPAIAHKLLALDGRCQALVRSSCPAWQVTSSQHASLGWRFFWQCASPSIRSLHNCSLI